MTRRHVCFRMLGIARISVPIPSDLWPKRELKTPAAHTCAILLVRDNRPEIGPFISFRLQMRSFRILPLSLAVMFGDASEIAILPNAKLASGRNHHGIPLI